jgi:hypothetical protein
MQWVWLSYLAERRAILIAEKQIPKFSYFPAWSLKRLIPLMECGEDGARDSNRSFVEADHA